MNYFKNSAVFVYIAFLFSLGVGVIKAFLMMSENNYLRQGLYRTSFSIFKNTINLYIGLGLLVALGVILLAAILRNIASKLLKNKIEIAVKDPNVITLFFSILFGFTALGYACVEIIRISTVPAVKVKSLLRTGLIVLGLFYLAIIIKKVECYKIKRNVIGILSLIRSKSVIITVFSFYIIINLAGLWLDLPFNSDKPNVLMIVLDALRFDHLGVYGYDRPVSPFIDQLVNESTVFESAWSNAPWTKPSMGTLFTGLYPEQHGALYWNGELDPNRLLLAELFREYNYSTMAIQTNPALKKEYGFAQGFEAYNEIIEENGAKVVNLFIEWLQKQRKPFFSYLHFMDTHVPYGSAERFSKVVKGKGAEDLSRARYTTQDVRIMTKLGLKIENKQGLVELYDESIRNVDGYISQIINELLKRNLLEKTIIVIMADHGEEFWEHGGFAHGHSLYNEVLRVPLIVRYPRKLQPQRIEKRISLVELGQLLLRLTGIERAFPSKYYKSGTLSGVKNDLAGLIYSEGILYGDEKKAIISGPWKLIANTNSSHANTFQIYGDLTNDLFIEKNPTFELYNLELDPEEKMNLYDNSSSVSRQMVWKMRSIELKYKVSEGQAIKEPADEKERKLEDLRSLGYIK